jgi:hypothetical protein
MIDYREPMMKEYLDRENDIIKMLSTHRNMIEAIKRSGYIMNFVKTMYEDKIQLYWTGYSHQVTITVKDNTNYDLSWEIAEYIMQRTNTEKIEKVFFSADAPRWLWLIVDEGLDYRIIYAEPDPECVPVKTIHNQPSFVSWTCERK